MSSMAPRHGHLLSPAPSGWLPAGQQPSLPPSLAKTLLSPHPAACSEATSRSIWAATGAVHRPQRVPPAGARRVRAHAACRAPNNPPHAAPGETTSVRLGHLRADVAAARVQGPGTQGSQTTQSDRPLATRVHCTRTYARTEDAQGHRHSRVWTRARVPLPGAQPGRAGAVTGADRPPAGLRAPAHGGESVSAGSKH